MSTPKIDPASEAGRLLFEDVLREERAALGWPPPPPPAPPGEPAPQPTHLAAICLSGGGIRSATFALGVIQGLAKAGMLKDFHYLSTVSGGGYIGSWLSAWMNRLHIPAPSPAAAAEAGLARAARNQPPGAGVESPPAELALSHLRRYSNYLTPRLGVLSGDTWTIAAVYTRNLLINWTLFLPVLVAVLYVPRLGATLTLLGPTTVRGEDAAWLWAQLGIISLLSAVLFGGFALPTAKFRRGELSRRSPAPSWAVVVLGTLTAGCGVCGWAAWGGVGVGAGRDGHTLAFAGVSPWLVGPGTIGALLFVAGYTIGVLWGRRGSGVRRAFTRWMAIKLGALVLGGYTLGALADASLRWFFPHPEADPLLYALLAFPMVLGVIFMSITALVAATSRVPGRGEEEDREWWARVAGWFGIIAVAWLAVGAIALYGPRLFDASVRQYLAPLGGLSGAVTLVLSRGSAAGAGKDKDPGAPRRGWRHYVLAAAAPVFAVTILCGVAWLMRLAAPVEAGPVRTLVMGAVVASALVLTPLVLNLNKFSSHAFYRHRLVRGYLAASRHTPTNGGPPAAGAHPAENIRDPDPFTDFDAHDNIQMYDLRSRTFGGGNCPNPDALLERIRAGHDELSTALEAALGKPPDWSTASDWLAGAIEALLRGSRPEILDAFRSVCWHPDEPDTPRPLPASVWNRILNEDDPYVARRRLLEWAYPGLVTPGCERPLHVVNMALNLTGGDDLAWQERKARSFTVTSMHAGSGATRAEKAGAGDRLLGYRASRLYGGQDGISLGTAMTISGAAVSPNMGYHSSPILGFLMTMFNVRLGAWLGNPGPQGAGKRFAYRRDGPEWALQPVISEAAGQADASSAYIHLSDGGHFENLGLYEMVRRGCTRILVSDAGCDEKCAFEDLGNAIRKIRTDLGAEIELKPRGIRQCQKGGDGCWSTTHFAFGLIRYPDGAVGEIIYIKPTLTNDEPTDVLQYHAAHPAFPHESTGDQFFSESQFESYRRLGMFAVDRMMKVTGKPGTLEDLFNAATPKL